ncbi:hypothetical protein MTO96_036599 [Rhipicephalus appendiculatus]
MPTRRGCVMNMRSDSAKLSVTNRQRFTVQGRLPTPRQSQGTWRSREPTASPSAPQSFGYFGHTANSPSRSSRHSRDVPDPRNVPLPVDSELGPDGMDTTSTRKRSRPSESGSEGEGASHKLLAVATDLTVMTPTTPSSDGVADEHSATHDADATNKTDFQLVLSKSQKRRQRTATPPRPDTSVDTPPGTPTAAHPFVTRSVPACATQLSATQPAAVGVIAAADTIRPSASSPPACGTVLFRPANIADSAECQLWQRATRLATIKASAPTYLPHREAQAALRSSPSRTGGPPLNQVKGKSYAAAVGAPSKVVETSTHPRQPGAEQRRPPSGPKKQGSAKPRPPTKATSESHLDQDNTNLIWTRRTPKAQCPEHRTLFNRVDAVCRRHANRRRRQSWQGICPSLSQARDGWKAWRLLRPLVIETAVRQPVLAVAIRLGITEQELAERLADRFTALSSGKLGTILRSTKFSEVIKF